MPAISSRASPGDGRRDVRRVSIRLGMILVPALLTMAVDALTKAWAEATLRMGEPIPVVGDLFRLMLHDSAGLASGLWQKAAEPDVLLAGTMIAALAGGLLAMLSRELLAMPRWPYGLLLGGALATLVDALRSGRETDFVDTGFGATRWPTFNLADSAMVLGVAALLALSLLGKRRSRFDGDRHAG